MIIDAFKNKTFPMVPTGFSEEEEEPIEEEPKEEVSEQITELDKFYGRDLIYKYFLENSLIKIMNKLKDYKKIPEKLQICNTLITRLNTGLKRLENDIKNMPEDEVENKKLGYLENLVRAIVDAGQKYDMPD